MHARSMTGFARVRRSAGSVEAVISIRSVNHRGLDLHFHMPSALDPFEPIARAAMRRHIERGHVQIHVALEKQESDSGGAALNLALLERWAAAFREAARVLQSNEHPSPHDALRVPGILQPESSVEWSPELEAALRECLDQALDELNAFRTREGEAIADEMRARAAELGVLTARMEKIRASATDAFHRRLKDKLADLLGGSAVDPQRLAQEAAILAERSDVSEEIVRLKTHAAQLLALLDSPGEKGKKLDFLLQEMNRESNTILSKTGGLGDHGLTLTDLGLGAKAEIDKMREQALNLE